MENNTNFINVFFKTNQQQLHIYPMVLLPWTKSEEDWDFLIRLQYTLVRNGRDKRD